MGGAEWTFLPASSENLNGFSPPSPRGERDWFCFTQKQNRERKYKKRLEISDLKACESIENARNIAHILTLLLSRLYCRFWNFTKSCNLFHCSRTLPPIGNFTLPRRLKNCYKFYPEFVKCQAIELKGSNDARAFNFINVSYFVVAQ